VRQPAATDESMNQSINQSINQLKNEFQNDAIVFQEDCRAAVTLTLKIKN